MLKFENETIILSQHHLVFDGNEKVLHMKENDISHSSRLSDYYQLGLKIQVEKTLVNDDNLAYMNQMVWEEDCYMKDFVENEKGEIYKVHYIKVTDY